MSNKFKTTLKAACKVADKIVYYGTEGGKAQFSLILGSIGEEQLTMMPAVCDEDDEEDEELQFVFPHQDIIIDEDSLAWVTDTKGKRHELGFSVFVWMNIHHMGLRSPIDTPLEIVEGYAELKGVVPRASDS